MVDTAPRPFCSFICQLDHRWRYIYPMTFIKMGDQSFGYSAYSTTEVKRTSSAKLDAQSAKIFKQFSHLILSGVVELIELPFVAFLSRGAEDPIMGVALAKPVPIVL